MSGGVEAANFTQSGRAPKLYASREAVEERCRRIIGGMPAAPKRGVPWVWGIGDVCPEPIPIGNGTLGMGIQSERHQAETVRMDRVISVDIDEVGAAGDREGPVPGRVNCFSWCPLVPEAGKL